MSVGEFVFFAIFGRVLIYLGGKFPISKIVKNDFIEKLFECDLCLGVWIYTILAYFLGADLVPAYFKYTPYLNEFLTGAVTSFIVWMVVRGYESEFSTVIIE